MELVNATNMPAGYTLGLAPDGRERLVVVVKGTFVMPAKGGVAGLAEEQADLLYSDTFSGEPGMSAVEYEYDFAPYKPACDVLLIGAAHAPRQRAVQSLPVGLQVGSWKKSFEVVGDRFWKSSGLGEVTPSEPEHFVSVPISYDVAFGGCEIDRQTQQVIGAYAANPVGRGYASKNKASDLAGKPLGNTQEASAPIKSPTGNYRPMSFGAVGRNFQERARHAGTYDQRWLDEDFPFLPPDFEPHYFQAAPADQQLPYLKGGESIQMLNLTAQGQLAFSLPSIKVPVECTGRKRARLEQEAVLDTLLLEPDRNRLQLTWRASFPIQRNIHEIVQVVVGRMPAGWYRARASGRTYYPSLGRLPHRASAD